MVKFCEFIGLLSKNDTSRKSDCRQKWVNERSLAVAHMKNVSERGKVRAKRVSDAIHDEVNDERGEDHHPAPAAIRRLVALQMT